jgi:hypothetical protein
VASPQPADHPALHPHLFGIITRQAIRRGTFTSVGDLIEAITGFIDGWNERCRPFVWTKDADTIIAKAHRKPYFRHARLAARPIPWSVGRNGSGCPRR